MKCNIVKTNLGTGQRTESTVEAARKALQCCYPEAIVEMLMTRLIEHGDGIVTIGAIYSCEPDRCPVCDDSHCETKSEDCGR